LVGGRVARGGTVEIVGKAWKSRIRKERRKISGHWAYRAWANLVEYAVARKLLPRKAARAVRHCRRGVIYCWYARRREITRLHGRCQQAIEHPGVRGRIAETVVIAVKEGLIPLNGPAQFKSELVLVVHPALKLKEAPRVDDGILEIFKYASMELIGARFEDILNSSRGSPPNIRVRVAPNDLKFLHCEARDGRRPAGAPLSRPEAY